MPGIYLSAVRNLFVNQKFIISLIEKYGKHILYTDDGRFDGLVYTVI
ncbi:MAG: hypothetical protein MRJ93_04930 [Nitrososphaeraceae archaeon]|nr:hypothetical protein [Nitrososphaeraceae archaeon]